MDTLTVWAQWPTLPRWFPSILFPVIFFYYYYYSISVSYLSYILYEFTLDIMCDLTSTRYKEACMQSLSVLVLSASKPTVH